VIDNIHIKARLNFETYENDKGIGFNHHRD